MDIELRYLEAFVAAATHRSFTKAAKALHVSQPTFTVQIKHLEEALGVKLLDRNTRSVQLTPIGRDLAPALERLLRELDVMLANVKTLSAKPSGVVTVAAFPGLSATTLPRIIAKFRVQNPGISVRLLDVQAARIATSVASGEVDFGLGAMPASAPELEFLPLFKERLSAIFTPGSRLGHKSSVALKDLLDHPLILFNRESSVRTIVDRAFASIGKVATPAYEAIYISTALGMVKAGLGVTILPVSLLEIHSAERLSSAVICRPPLYREQGVILKRGRSLSPAAREFLNAIHDACDRSR